ncbi:MAG: 2-phospho-L-lactate transferase [Acidimicrobiia bacterium]
MIGGRHADAIVEPAGLYRNPTGKPPMVRIALLSGGVGGARLARGLYALDGIDASIIVNVGDDEVVYGLDVSPDIDTVLYTLASVEGPHGWGIEGDAADVMSHLEALGLDTSFHIGDRDLATNLARTQMLRDGASLSEVTRRIASALGVAATILPVTDDTVRTMLRVDDGWIRFQEYFVLRGQKDTVHDIRFDGADVATPAPGVLDAVRAADVVLIAPSNPPLSIWPILAIPDVADAVAASPRVICVSPLFGGRALKGPAHVVLRSLGMSAGNRGVVEAYRSLLDDLVIDIGDAPDRSQLSDMGLRVHVHDTRISESGAASAFAEWLIGLL